MTAEIFSAPSHSYCEEKCFPKAHLVIPVAIGIIFGICIALSTYFLAHKEIMWTAIGGSIGAVVSGLISYALIRCSDRKKTSVTVDNASNKDPKSPTSSERGEKYLQRFGRSFSSNSAHVSKKEASSSSRSAESQSREEGPFSASSDVEGDVTPSTDEEESSSSSSEERRFMGRIIGDSLYSVDLSGQKTKIENLDPYQKDQDVNGRYQELEIQWQAKSKCGNVMFLVFNRYGLDLSSVHLILSKGRDHGHQSWRRLWIFIPHCIDRNQFPSDTKVVHVNCGYPVKERVYCKPGLTPQEIYRDPNYEYLKGCPIEVFNPQKHRLPGYDYGSYYELGLDEGVTYQLSLSPEKDPRKVWLQLRLEYHPEREAKS